MCTTTHPRETAVFLVVGGSASRDHPLLGKTSPKDLVLMVQNHQHTSTFLRPPSTARGIFEIDGIAERVARYGGQILTDFTTVPNTRI